MTTTKAVAVASAKDPTAWVAFVGFVLGGIQTLIGASGDTLFSARAMGLLTLSLGVAGLIVRGVEMYFLKRAPLEPPHDDGTADDTQ